MTGLCAVKEMYQYVNGSMPANRLKTFHTAFNEIKHAARVLSRYRDARRTRILRIRLRLTVRVNKKPDANTDLIIIYCPLHLQEDA